jgi:hypothetical protein
MNNNIIDATDRFLVRMQNNILAHRIVLDISCDNRTTNEGIVTFYLSILHADESTIMYSYVSKKQENFNIILLKFFKEVLNLLRYYDKYKQLPAKYNILNQ